MNVKIHNSRVKIQLYPSFIYVIKKCYSCLVEFNYESEKRLHVDFVDSRQPFPIFKMKALQPRLNQDD